MAHLRRNTEFEHLEARLREEHPRAPDDLVARLAARAATPRSHRTSGRLRYGIALGFTAALAAAFAVLGGLTLLPDANQQVSRLAVPVPVKAVPVLRTLQAKGIRLAATPALLGQRGVAKADSGGVEGMKAIELETETSIDTTTTGTKRQSEKGVSSSVARKLVPHITSGAGTIRLPAAVVYPPGPSTVLCLRVPIPPDVYYFTVIVPLASVPALFAQYPGSSWGPCIPS